MSKRVTDEVCLKIRGANIVAQVTLQYLWGKPWCRPVQKIAKARDLLAKDGQWCQGREKELQNLFHCSPKSSKSTKWWDTKRRLVGSVLEIPFTRCTTYWSIEKLKRYVARFKVVWGKLFKRSFQGMWMVCIPTKEANGILSALHEGEPAGHPSGRRLWQMALHQRYY